MNALENTETLKSLTDAFFTLVDKARSLEPSSRMQPPPTASGPKTMFVDPYQLMDSLGMGYKHAPSQLTFDTLTRVAEKNDIIASIHITRTNQMAAFCRPQKNKYSVGFKITPRGPDKRREYTHHEKRRIQELTDMLMFTGREFDLQRDSFDTWMRKSVRDSLTYDQVATEKVGTTSGGLHEFFAVPADTIRIATPKISRGTPLSIADAKRDKKYVQLVNGRIETDYTIQEMMFGVRNPRTNMRVFGYGFPEIEQLITTVTSHLYAEEWNRRAFSQGSTVKGVLNLQGQMPMNQFEMFKRQWQAQVSGISNAWKTPVTNQEGVQWIPLQMNNVEMGYQMWIEYLIKVISAIYQIDPAEINFDLRGGSQQQPLFMSSNEAQQKVSKDRGLRPLLAFFEDQINKHIIWRIDPRFEMEFVGLDAKTEEQAMQLRTQQGQTLFTLNELRAMEDMKPLPDGDIVLNPTYTGYMMQKKQMDAQSQMMQQQPGAPGGAPGGPPGAPPQAQGPGQDGQGEDPSQSMPYMNKFKKPPGDEEKRAANTLNGFVQRGEQNDQETSSPMDPQHSTSSEDSDDGPDDDDLSSIHINDWDSSLHAALNSDDNDLHKSVTLYDTFEV